MGTILQIRIDNELKNQATQVFDNLGLDLSTAIRIFLKKSVSVNGIPFEVKNQTYNQIKFENAVKEMQQTSKKNGNDKLTIDEINNIISDTRKIKNK